MAASIRKPILPRGSIIEYGIVVPMNANNRLAIYTKYLEFVQPT